MRRKSVSMDTPETQEQAAPSQWHIRLTEDAYAVIGRRVLEVPAWQISDGLLKTTVDGRPWLISLSAILYIRPGGE